ncbi:MAG TPA: class I SAM-dependent methyltransferase, partial [Solirubrobacteraceae bacterium]|nr:class I SAM-dependent methyltransferase [Solirubrobacteraceae bacterium]
MHRFWHHVIRPILEAADPATIVEVGAYRGENTRNLVDYAREHGAALHVVDPAPLFDPAELLAPAGDRAVFHRTLSLNVLGSIEAPDAVLIDGDHNWFTVINELRLLARSSGRAGRAFPLVLLHDVGWPYGRRDLYYEPDRIPDAFRQPVRRGGLRPETPELAKTGGLNPHLDHSIYENDLRNGVLTAVEDFVSESAEELRVVTLPGLHGLGLVVAARRLEERPALAAAVARLGSAEFLEEHARWVERARVDVLIESVEQRARRQAAEQQL